MSNLNYKVTNHDTMIKKKALKKDYIAYNHRFHFIDFCLYASYF